MAGAVSATLSMNRTRRAFEVKFRALLVRVRARRIDQGLRWLVEQGERTARREQVSLAHAFTQVYLAVLKRVERRPAARPSSDAGETPVRFLCDAGLGGLARWLRAAGYDAGWSADITDDDLIRQALGRHAVVVTTDSLLLERRVLRDGELGCVWVPPSLRPLEQLALALDELRLPLRDPLCMNCGGPLRRVDKEAMRERIPPRTYLWLDEYFLCQRCGQLFWHGTHWAKIVGRLKRTGFAAQHF